MTPATAVAVASEAPAPAPVIAGLAASSTGTGTAAAGAKVATESGGGGAERRSRFRRICVYFGSAKGKKPATRTRPSNSATSWIIPKSLMPREVTGEPVGEVRAVSGMHERKAEMARFADAFVALPGGYGTLEELLEIITWVQLGIHKKPVGLLNVDGFYDPLLSFIDLAVNEGFITEAARHIIISAPTAKELVMKLEDYVPEYDIGLVWEEQKAQQLGP
ncbi:unnamed protein product [Miscanthus lutarioriparius]|uniref:Cytokinin riboside 5'-monophosphate phosphoribohydrolase n=1 Tax=Miscanthus lutarioriparius TaxID=422564 RepID=A0A811Q7I2_9POAL|nr:unnamed protein product [Miscanthus lutarioriparius]